MDIAKKIYYLRTENSLTQSEFAEIAGVSDKAVSAWENGTRDPKMQPVKNICSYFGIDINVFIDESNDIYKSSLPSNISPLPNMQKVPLVGSIACGTPILAEENITDYIDLPGHIRADYALTCRGDSMINAGIRDGDVVYIRKQDTVDNGQIAAVLIDDMETEATLKRFYFVNGKITLVAENSAYPPMVYDGEDAATVHIVGLAVAYTHAIER